MTDRCPCSVLPVSAAGSGSALLSCMCPDRARMSSDRDFFDSLPGAALRFSQAPAGPGRPSSGIPCPCPAYLLEKNDQGHPGNRASCKPPPWPAPEAPRPLAALSGRRGRAMPVPLPAPLRGGMDSMKGDPVQRAVLLGEYIVQHGACGRCWPAIRPSVTCGAAQPPGKSTRSGTETPLSSLS